MKKIDVIFLDMDGVIADFIGSVEREFVARGLLKKGWKDSLLSYSIHNTMNKDAYNKFWKHCEDFKVFERADEFSHTRALIALCQNYTHDICILTSAGDTPSFFAQKKAWLNAHGFKHEKVVMTKNKELLAASNRLLIDDCEANCEAFSRFGGDSILFPQLWNRNRNYRCSPLDFVEDAFKLWQEGTTK